MKLSYVILAIPCIIGLLVWVLGYNKKSIVKSPIPYPQWVVILKYFCLVVGVSCFMFAAYLAKNPPKCDGKVCIYLTHKSK